MCEPGRTGLLQPEVLTVVVSGLFPAETVVQVSSIDRACSIDLVGDEYRFIEQAVERRQREFKAGRSTARRALAPLGFGNVELPRSEQGHVLWPAGVVGSISHAGNWCLAVAAKTDALAGLGVDIEDVGRMSEGVANKILCDEERHGLEQLDMPMLQGASMLFSAKEAVYKTLYPVIEQFIGFQDAEIVPETKDGGLEFSVKLFLDHPSANDLAQCLKGRMTIINQWAIAGVVLNRS